MNLVTEENILDSEEIIKDKESDVKKLNRTHKSYPLHGKKFPSFLGSKECSLRNTWELVIIFDSDHSCFLANQHIMSRRLVQRNCRKMKCKDKVERSQEMERDNIG